MTIVGNPFNTPSGRVTLDASNQTINALNQLAAGGAPPTSPETTSGLTSSNAGTIATAPITTSGTVLGASPSSSITQSTIQSPAGNMQQLMQTLTQVVAQLQQIMTQLSTVMTPNTNGGGAVQTPAPGGGKPPNVQLPTLQEPAPPPGGGPTDSQQMMQALSAITQQVQQLVQLVNTMMPGGINQNPVPGGGKPTPGGGKPVLPGEPVPGGGKPTPGGGKPHTDSDTSMHLAPLNFGGKPVTAIKHGLQKCENLASKLLNGKFGDALDNGKLGQLHKEFQELIPRLKNDTQRETFAKASNLIAKACDKNLPAAEREMYLAGVHSFLSRQIDALK